MTNKCLQKKHHKAVQLSFFIGLLFYCIIANGKNLYSIAPDDFQNSEYFWDDCMENVNADWSRIEKFAWLTICTSPTGSVDFKLERELSDSDPNIPEPELSQEFLNNILADQSLTSNIHRTGITIRYATFKDTINLEHLHINFPLIIEDSLFESDVLLNHIVVKDALSFKNTIFNRKLDMTSANINGNLIMNGTKFFNNVFFVDANINNDLDLSNAIIGETEKEKIKLDMHSINVGGDILMRNTTSTREINLSYAVIKGSLNLEDANIQEKLDMESIDIGDNLFMRKSPDSDNYKKPPIFHTTNLREATVNGRMSLTGAMFNCEKEDADNKCQLNMDSISVNGDLHIRNAEFNFNVFLTDANIGDELSLSCSIFKEQIKMDSISIGSNLYINNVSETGGADEKRTGFSCSTNPRIKKLTLTNATIGNNFEIKSGEIIETFDIRSSHIGGDLYFFSSSFPEEMDLRYIHVGSKLEISNSKKLHLLDLRNAKTSSFKMPTNSDQTNDSFTGVKLKLNGFTYLKIENEENVINDDSVKKMIALLEGSPYRPQPYVQLAGTLNNMAYTNEASKVLIAKLDHKQNHAVEYNNDYTTFIKLFLYKWILGYGYGAYYGYFNSLGLVIVFVLIGVLLLFHERRKLQIEENKGKFTEDLFYSFDMLLPLVTLDKRHEGVVHRINYIRYYFYVHKIVGYVLAVIIVAGLSGMLNPSGL